MTLIEFLQTTEQNPTRFAGSIGVAPSTVIRWIKGKRKPGLALLMKIKDKTGGRVSPEDFQDRAA